MVANAYVFVAGKAKKVLEKISSIPELEILQCYDFPNNEIRWLLRNYYLDKYCCKFC